MTHTKNTIDLREIGSRVAPVRPTRATAKIFPKSDFSQKTAPRLHFSPKRAWQSGVLLGLAALVFYLLPGQAPTDAAALPVVPEFVALTSDTATAGEMATLQSTPIAAGELLQAKIEKPDGSVVTLSGRADQSGIVKINLLGNETEQAGIYKIKPEAQNYLARETTLRVRAAAIDLSKSRLLADKALAKADGSEGVELSVKLRDQFGNGVAARGVQFVSSRNADLISREHDQTDAHGEISATVKSIKSGTSYLTVFEEQGGEVIGKPLEIKFYSPHETVADFEIPEVDAQNYTDDDLARVLKILANEKRARASQSHTVANVLQNATARRARPFSRRSLADLLRADLTSTPQNSVHHFEIEGVSQSLKAGQPVASVLVRAVDRDGFLVDDYTGTVHWRSSDEKAILPRNTQFQAENQGERSFDLAVTLVTPGEHTLVVEDVDDNGIFGQIPHIEVESTSQLVGAAPTISTPTDGVTVSTSTIKIAGRATAGALVSVYDGVKKLGETTAETSGRWVFTTPNLYDGAHQFAAVATGTDNEVSPVSETVTVTIDSTKPTNAAITLDPDTAAPRAKVRVQLQSEDELKKVEIIIERRIIELVEDPKNEGTYLGSFIAPKKSGKYELAAILTDALGNSETYENLAQLRVKNEQPATPEPEQTSELEPVTDVRVLKQDESSVTLGWREVPAAVRYEVRYNEEADDLAYKIAVDASATRGTVDGLVEGVDYYFAVVAVDADGNRSKITEKSRAQARVKISDKYAEDDVIVTDPPQKDAVEPAAPVAPEPKVVQPAHPPKKVVKKIIKVPRPRKNASVGPGGIILLSLLAAVALGLATRRRSQL